MKEAMSTAILEMIETGDMDALHNKWFVLNGKWARAGNIGICVHINVYSFVGSTWSVTAKRGRHSGGKCACAVPYSNRESQITRNVAIANQLTITIWQRQF